MKKYLLTVVLAAACSSPTVSDPEYVAETNYNSQFTGVASNNGSTATCNRAYNDIGSIKISWEESSSGEINNAKFIIPLNTRTNVSATGALAGCNIEEEGIFAWQGEATVTANSISINDDVNIGSLVENMKFAGTRNGNVITGTITFTETGKDISGLTRSGSGSKQLTFNSVLNE